MTRAEGILGKAQNDTQKKNTKTDLVFFVFFCDACFF